MLTTGADVWLSYMIMCACVFVFVYICMCACKSYIYKYSIVFFCPSVHPSVRLVCTLLCVLSSERVSLFCTAVAAFPLRNSQSFYTNAVVILPLVQHIIISCLKPLTKPINWFINCRSLFTWMVAYGFQPCIIYPHC